MRLHRSVTVEKPLDTVFGYLSDFTTTTQCDPGTVKTVRTSGDGGFGTEYLNTSAFAGRYDGQEHRGDLHCRLHLQGRRPGSLHPC